MIRNKIFYNIKPFVPRRLQIALRRVLAERKRKLFKDVWPIDPNALKRPDNWPGWPDKKQFAFVLTHDVESAIGIRNCLKLAALEESLGFRSSFNFVINDYQLPPEIRLELVRRGFEIGIHGVTHNGKHLQTREAFDKHLPIIHQYLEKWQAVGYRTPSMLGNPEWIQDLHIEYDASTYDTDPFEPKPNGVQTIFPYRVASATGNKGFVELPYSLAQDFTLFIILKEKNIDIWTRKLDWIAHHGGMALLITHPDYMNFGNKRLGIDEYAIGFYKELLEYVQSRYEGQYWHVLPKEMAQFWKSFQGAVGCSK